MEKENKATRKGSPPIKVYCLPEERHQIQANAQATGLSLSTFLLNVGIGYQVRGIWRGHHPGGARSNRVHAGPDDSRHGDGGQAQG
jgi:hypothetical protein